MASSPAYDPQRQDVYRMEKHGLFGLNKTRQTKEEHRRILRLASKKFGLKPPRLIYSPNLTWAGMFTHEPTPTVTISTKYQGGLGAMTLLHELSHYFVQQCDPGDALEPHGPEFVGVYGDLMECMGFVPFGAWGLLTGQFNVLRLDTGNLSPTQLLTKVKKRAAFAAPKSPPRRRS